MKIAYVIENCGVWGGVKIVARHLEELKARGHEAWLLTLENSPLTWLPVTFYQAWLPTAPPLIDQFDVVVATSGGTWKMVAHDPRFGRARRMVLVQMLESLFYAPESETYKAYLPNLKLPLRPIVISQWLKDEMAKFNRLPATLIPNGIDPLQFYPDPNPAPHPLRLLVEGSTSNQAKDVDEMAHFAIEALRVAGYQFEVWGFSQSPPRWAFDKYWVLPDQDTIRWIYQQSDILVKATRWEGRPAPDLEATACGCVVNRAIEFGDDDLKHGFNCLKVAYGDLEGFTANLQRLAVDRYLRARLVANGQSYIRENCDWAKIIPQLEAALAE